MDNEFYYKNKLFHPSLSLNSNVTIPSYCIQDFFIVIGRMTLVFDSLVQWYFYIFFLPIWNKIAYCT